MRWMCLILILGACGQTVQSDSVITAQPYIGLDETQDRKQIKEIYDVKSLLFLIFVI